MVMPMENDRRYQIIPYPSEHVIEDGAGNKVVSCPTEQEAREYIKEVLEGEAVLSPPVDRRRCEQKSCSHEKNAINQHSSNNDVLGGICSED